MEHIIVREYIESLNESKELDYIFPLLLESMGFRLISTPISSKGQSQYGRDVVAVRKDEDGQYYKYYFELKGFFAKDINDKTLLVKDGFRDSILAAKYTAFNDASIPRFNSLPIKIIYVHNGILVENTRNTYDGFIQQEFPNGGFERWDIYRLTELFSQYLFNEYLLTDHECVRLFKRTLVLLDAPDNDFSDFKQLIDNQLNKVEIVDLRKRREIINLFSSLKLLLAVVYKYSQENNNLYPAKECVNHTVLKTWGWILKNRLESKKSIVEKFNALIIIQKQIYHDYISKTATLAQYPKGLFGFMSTTPEVICYPLRCFDYLNDLLYLFYASNAYLGDDVREKIITEQKAVLINIIKANSGCTSPLLDNHSITIQLVLKFILTNSPSQAESQFVADYISKLTYNLILTYKKKSRWPELHSNSLELAKSHYKKSEDYCDTSSLLLTFIFELLAYIHADELYIELKKVVDESKVNLQVAYPILDLDIEQSLFEKPLYDEMSVEVGIKLPETLAVFRSGFRKRYTSIEYRTDKTGYFFLRLLAHIYYKTDFFPDELNVGFCLPLEPSNLHQDENK
jgi:hypothetical protein